jgi:uncharacterized membrane protein SirB2
MWEGVFLLAVVLLLAMHLLIRRLPSTVSDSLMLASGIGMIVLVILAPGAETWHRYGLLAIGILSILRGGWRFWRKRVTREAA